MKTRKINQDPHSKLVSANNIQFQHFTVSKAEWTDGLHNNVIVKIVCMENAHLHHVKAVMVQSRGPLKKPVPSRPVPRDKRDGTGQEWIASMGRTS